MGTPERPTTAAGGEQWRSSMSQLFRRNRSDDSAPPPALVLAPNTGIVCNFPGCANDTAQPCAYRDGRGRACRTAFCPAHGVAADGKLYCRRHAGVVRAVGAEATPSGGLPDVDNRLPSLVSWIARDLDTNVRRLLTGAARSGESVIADETVHVARDFNRKARWEQSWRLVDHTGVILKVTIQVLEENDSLVRVNVGSGVIADGVQRADRLLCEALAGGVFRPNLLRRVDEVAVIPEHRVDALFPVRREDVEAGGYGDHAFQSPPGDRLRRPFP